MVLFYQGIVSQGPTIHYICNWIYKIINYRETKRIMLQMLFLCAMAFAMAGKHEYDRKMLEELNTLVPTGRRKKVDRQLGRSIIGLEHRLGLGVHWSNQLANDLHKPVLSRFDKRTVFAKHVNDIWTAELFDMSPFSRSNKGYKYLLTVIDVFSK